MIHPKSRAERRRLKRKKEYIDKQDREDLVARRLAEETLEQKEALDVLRRQVLQTED